MHLILFVGWTVTTLLTKLLKTTSRKLPPDSFWTRLRTQDFAGVVPHGSCVQSVVIVLRKFCHTMKRVSRASRPGLLVGFLRILCNGLCTARRFHNAENDHTLAVLDARMNLTPSLITMCVPGCTISSFPSGDMLRFCQQEIACCTTGSPGCSCWSHQHGIVVLRLP